MENENKKPLRDLLQFRGSWRNYQKRILDNADHHLADEKIHIVAPPGSGKTTLGIELIRRIGEPALILSPTINIRNQWLGRMKEAYLPETSQETSYEGILSDSLEKPGFINAITYQALFSYSESMELSGVIKAAGIRTLCLDEAHHLRSEWWRVLEELVRQVPECRIISLTATPPYDASKAEWERYIGLCGPIDEEIIVPELVKEGSLCPHQDYIFFNLPTREENLHVKKFREAALETALEIYNDPAFTAAICSHPGIRQPELYAEKLLDTPAYLSSMVVFLNTKGIDFSRELIRLLGAKGRIPKISLEWMEILLQGFLFDDKDSFVVEKDQRENLEEMLKGQGLIQKNKVTLTNNEKLNKLLTNSKGKIKSIVAITAEEYENLGSGLRLLILTDYIKKEYLSALGDENRQVSELGVVPIFENIRRHFEKKGKDQELRLAALSGSVVIIPETAIPALEDLTREQKVRVVTGPCTAPGYLQVSVTGSEETASSLLTELFYQGQIRVLIGTKSLLGEGWDSPCINALILASFVGSYMLSNQMRGRAIRTFKDDPDKTSNIWHLICMEPKSLWGGQEDEQNMKEPGESEDFTTLTRRFEGFLGVHYEADSIENGLDRLSVITKPYTAANLKAMNEKMLNIAADRHLLKDKWNNALTVLDGMEIASQTGIDKEYLSPGVLLFNAFAETIISAILGVSLTALYTIPKIDAFISGRSEIGVIFLLLLLLNLVLPFLVYKYAGRLMILATPFRHIGVIGQGVLEALKQSNAVESSKVKVMVECEGEVSYFTYLKGGSQREKTLFANCMLEMFAAVDNQRYLLRARGKVPRLIRYYCVPEMFGKKKEDAVRFLNCLKPHIGHYELIYTRSEAGRKELLKARIHSFANKNEQLMNQRRKVKSQWK